MKADGFETHANCGVYFSSYAMNFISLQSESEQVMIHNLGAVVALTDGSVRLVSF